MSEPELDITGLALTKFRRLRAYVEKSLDERAANAAENSFSRTNSFAQREPKKLSDLLDDFAIAADLADGLAVGTLSERWAEIVGSEIAEHVTIREFDVDNATLHLETDSTAWAVQIQMLTPALLSKIAAEVGEGVVVALTVSPPKAPSWKYGKRSVPGRGPRDTYG